MLQALRGTVGSWVVKILFIMLILSFGVWGIGDIFRNKGPANTVAEVGGIEISRQELDQAFRQQVQRLSPLFGGQFDLEQAVAMGLLDQSLQQLIQRDLIDLAARDAGLLVGDAMIRQRIAEEPAFRNRQGQFDPDVFRRVLQANNLSEAGLVEVLRRDVARETVLGAVTAGAQPPQPLVADLYRFHEETRVAEVVTIRSAGFGDVGQPDEATLVAFHQDKAVRFTAPEYRALTVASLTIDDIAGEIAVPEADLQAAYESRAAEFRTPERRTAEQALVETEEKARAIVQAAGNAAGLAEAAKQAGIEAQPIGQVIKEDLPEELADAVFALAPGAVTQPIRSALGWHVVAVTAVEPGSTRAFEQVKDQLLAEIRREKAADRLFEISNKVEDALAAGAGIDQAAAAQGLKIRKIDATDASGKTPAGSPLPGVPAQADVLKSAFTLEKGRESRLTETKDGGYFIVRVDDVTPPKLRPLDEVRPQVIAAWAAEQRAGRAAEQAGRIAGQLREGAAAEVVATAAGAEVLVSAPFSRNGKGANLPPALVATLFDAKPGEVATAATADGQIVARLKEIRVADPAVAVAALEPIRQQASQGIASDLAVQFAEALRRKYPVEIDQATLRSLYQRGN